MSLSYRDAVPSDAELLRYWDTLPHVKASDPHSDWEWEEDLMQKFSWRQQWISLHENKPIGFIQIIDPAEETSNYWGITNFGYRAIDIWIGPQQYLNKGYGTEMMKHAIHFSFEIEQAHTILIDPLLSNKAAQRFYQRLGFEPIEERQFGDDQCLVMSLAK